MQGVMSRQQIAPPSNISVSISVPVQASVSAETDINIMAGKVADIINVEVTKAIGGNKYGY